MSQTPLLGVRATPAIPITSTSIGTDPSTTGIPTSPTNVEQALTELQAEIDAVTQIVVQEDDGSPTVVASEIDVPNGTLDVSGTVATLNYLGSRGGGRGTLDARSVSGAITLDLAAYNAFQLTLTGNVTSVTLSNPPPSGVDATWPLAVIQGGSGGYTWAWPAACKFRATDGTNTGSAPALFTAVGGQDDFDISTGDGGTTYGVTPSIPPYSLTVDDEGTPLATGATSLDFVGAGVTASGTGVAKTITIPGGATSSDTGIWRPLLDGATGAVIQDGATGEANMGFGAA